MIDLNLITPYLPEKFDTLQITEVGSQMWGMGTISSDHDMVIIYKERTKDILRGRTYHPTLPCKHHIMAGGEEFDFTYLEIGHFCHQLKKGNVNMIWALMSPLVSYRIPSMKVIHDMIDEVHTDDIIPSGLGLTQSQLSDATKRASVRPPEKSIKTAWRTANFVLTHLMEGTWKFEPVEYDPTEEHVLLLMDGIKDVELNKQFDSMPVKDIENWLLNFRISTL